MSLFIGAMRKHVDGKKELTNHSELVVIQAEKRVYLPLINMGSTSVEVLVKENDKVFVGTKVACRNDNFMVPFFSSVSGKVIGTEKRVHSSGKDVDHLIIENDGKYTQKFDIKPLDWEKATNEELVDFMMNSGMVGCGGAGFPTYIKYKFAKDIHTLIINGVECEPYITADYREMDTQPSELLLGVKAMKKMCGANVAYIAIKKSKKELIAKISELVSGVEGIEVKMVPDVYPMGWERTLVYEIAKKRYDKLPSEIGIIVNNATTAICFAKALTSGQPIISKVVTFSGNALVKNANVEVPIGVPVSEVISKLGGYGKEEGYVIAGGPMMGTAIKSDEFVIHAYANAVTVLETKPQDEMACLRCGRCSDYCPAGIQPVRIKQAHEIKDVEMVKNLGTDLCIECGMCSMVCPSHIAITESIRKAKRALMLANQKAGGK